MKQFTHRLAPTHKDGPKTCAIHFPFIKTRHTLTLFSTNESWLTGYWDGYNRWDRHQSTSRNSKAF